MKKRLKNLCSVAILPLMLLTSGCFNGEVSDEKGKEWAEKMVMLNQLNIQL